MCVCVLSSSFHAVSLRFQQLSTPIAIQMIWCVPHSMGLFACGRLRMICVAVRKTCDAIKSIRIFLLNGVFKPAERYPITSRIRIANIHSSIYAKRTFCGLTCRKKTVQHMQKAIGSFFFHWNGLTPRNNCSLIVTVIYLYICMLTCNSDDI